MESKKYILNWFLYAILLFLCFLAFRSYGQSQPGKPNERINVHKETDENGNIIRYDSTYHYSYSGDLSDLNIDSIFRNFNHNFSHFNFDMDFSPFDFSEFRNNMDVFGKDFFKEFEDLMQEQNRQFEKYLKKPDSTPHAKPQRLSPGTGNSKEIKI